MSDPTGPPRPPPPDPSDGELASAYLSGDLDERAAADFERRLEHDPALARRLDDVARVLTSLRGVDDVEPPAGAGDRLRRRLSEERAAPAGSPAADDEAGDEAGRPASVTPLASRRRVRWSAVAGVAAGLAAVALVGGGLLQGFGDRSADVALDAADGDAGAGAAREESASGEQRALQAPPEAADQPAPDAQAEDEPALDGQDEDEPAPRPAADRPVILDTDVVLDAGRARTRYRGLPEATALLGLPLAEGEDQAAVLRAAAADAPPFRSGAAPGDCLPAAGDGRAPAAPVRIESAVVDGEAAVAYVLVTAGEGSATLDRVEVWALTADGCDTRLVVDVTE